jgi:hypothetical protein
VYAEVPPLNDEAVESVDDWPLSTVVGETEIVGAARAGLTVTLTVVVAVPPTESVTRTQ